MVERTGCSATAPPRSASASAATVSADACLPTPTWRWPAERGDGQRRPVACRSMGNSILGHRVTRREDPAMLTVGGTYVDDLAPQDALFVTFVRSTMAHATITELDISEALESPGVVGVYTIDDLDLADVSPMPMLA